jgi:tetratricopeptide (TPR) repeat protein
VRLARSHRRAAYGATLLLLVSLFSRTVFAGDFEKANELYDAGRFPEAKQLYERLLESGTRSANLAYDLANTDYRIGSPGRAILGYERALALDPQHPEALANLKLLREQTHARDLDRSLPERTLLRVDANVWTVTAALAGWIAVFCLVLAFTTRRRDRVGLWLGTVASLLVAGLSGVGISLHERDRALAIVTAREVEAHLAPAESAALAGILPAGSRVRVLSERGPWVYCELPDERRGWLTAGAIERVRPVKS